MERSGCRTRPSTSAAAHPLRPAIAVSRPPLTHDRGAGASRWVHPRGMDAGCSLEAPNRDALLGLATVCALMACATISGMRPTVLIVDDHAAFRASARALLQAEGFDIVGEAADGVGAVEAVAVLRPEIVLLDIQLPDLDGLAVAEQLAAVPDAPAVVLISSRDAAAYGPRLQATPARGFIPKSGLSGEALAALIG